MPSVMRKEAAPQQGSCSTRNYFVKCEIALTGIRRATFPCSSSIPPRSTPDRRSPCPTSIAQYYANSLAARSSPTFDSKSIYLIDAASLSARFPIALPAGFLSGFGGTNSIRLVDGGYFDGSGLSVGQAVKPRSMKVAGAKPASQGPGDLFGRGCRASTIRSQRTSTATPTVRAQIEPPGRRNHCPHQGATAGPDQQSAETVRQIFRADPSALGFDGTRHVGPIRRRPAPNIPLAWYLAPCTLHSLKIKLQKALENSEVPRCVAGRPSTPG